MELKILSGGIEIRRLLEDQAKLTRQQDIEWLEAHAKCLRNGAGGFNRVIMDADWQAFKEGKVE